MKIVDGTIILPKAELRALIGFVSKDEYRESIGGICIDAVKGVLSATDGHALCRLYAARGEPNKELAKWWIKLELCKRLERAMGKGDELRITNSGDVKIYNNVPARGMWRGAKQLPAEEKLVAHYGKLEYCPVSLPDYVSVIRDALKPIEASRIDWGMNMDLLARMQPIQKCFRVHGQRCVLMRAPKDPLSPMLMTSMVNEDGSQWVVVAMPMRYSDKDVDLIKSIPEEQP